MQAMPGARARQRPPTYVGHEMTAEYHPAILLGHTARPDYPAILPGHVRRRRPGSGIWHRSCCRWRVDSLLRGLVPGAGGFVVRIGCAAACGTPHQSRAWLQRRLSAFAAVNMDHVHAGHGPAKKRHIKELSLEHISQRMRHDARHQKSFHGGLMLAEQNSALFLTLRQIL